MLDKFRVPYLILGLGIGIILTSTIYTLNPNVKYKEYTEEEIITAATDLGMVFVKDSIDTSRDKKSKREEQKDKKGKEEIILVVEAGDNSEKVFDKLLELGVITDKKDFSKYAKEKNIEKRIRIGTYKLALNMDYDTIISILTKSSL